MKKLVVIAALATATLAPAAYASETSQSVQAATEAAGTVQVDAGKMLYSSTGHRIASIYRVTAEGNPQVILDGRLITVPASTLSDADGKVTTSLSKRELARSK